MTLFDLIAVVVILLSVLAGLSSGAIRELVGLFAFGLAVVGAVLLLPVSGPLARSVVQPRWAASAVAIVLAFLVIYIALQVGGRFLTARVRDSGPLGTLDRIGGGGVGAVRAAVLLGVFYLVYRAATPVELRPPWIERAALFPAAQLAGTALQTITPKGMAAGAKLGPSLKNALSSAESDEPSTGGSDAPTSTSPRARRDSRPERETTTRGAPRNGLDVVVERSR